MKSKLTMMVAMAVTCVAVQLTAMPTEKETKQAEPIVRRLLASEREALESGKKTRSEVADKAVELAGEADSDAAKLLLMKGAFVLYVQDGNLEKAVETMKALEAAIADMPPQSVTNMIELALLGVSKTGEGARLYKILDEKRGADRPNVKYKFSYKLEGGNAIITSIDPKPAGTVVIPDKIDGHKVTGMEGYNDESPFWGCDQLTRVVLPSGLEEGPAGALMSCKSLSSIEISSSNKKFASLDGALYSKDFSTLIVYPKTRESIKLSPKTRKIGGCAFRGCALKTAKIPEGIVEVGHWNLCGCPDLEWVEFPKSLKFLGHCAAHGNDKLKKIVFNGDAPKVGLAQFTWGKQYVFTGAPENLVVEVRKGTKGWKSPDSTELPARWPTNQKYSRPICYIGEVRSVNNGVAQIKDAKATVDGYTWSYRVKNGEATIVAEKNGKHSCAVSPTPTGDFSIPATLGGVKVTHIGWEAFRYCKELTSVTIPEGVSHIDGHTFDQCYGLKSVTLPSSLKGIGWAAFGGCAELKSIVIPEGVTSIRADTFNGCRSLKNVVIPNSMTHIGERAFLGCQELTSVTIPAKVASIGEGAFVWGSKLKQINLATDNQSFTLVDGVLYKKDMSVLLACLGDTTAVTIPSGVTKIGAFAFRGCTRLKSVTIPEGVTDIGWVAFVNCQGLKSLTIPESVKVVGPAAFKDCGELDSVTMRGERPDAQNGIFKNCGKLKAIHVPANAKSWAGMKEWQGIPLVFDTGNAVGKDKTVTEGKETVDGIEWTYNIIGGQAQVDYASSSNVTGAISIPSTLGGCPVTSIGRNEFRSGFGWRVFERCRHNMTSVAIPSGVVNIGDSAFFGCSNLVSVTIPASVTNIARCAFSRCASLTSFAVDAENTKYSSRNGLLCSKDGSALIASVNGDVTIPPSVKDIADYAFQGRIGLKSVMIPSGVTSVGLFAFEDCSGLKSVAIPASMKKIGWYAFSGCSGLMSFSVDSDNPSFSSRDGMLCSKNGSTLVAGVNGDVTIPPCVKEIGSHAFCSYSGLKSVRMPENVTSIAAGAFRGCHSLLSVTIPPRVTSIGPQAFYWCKKLASVTIPASVTKIERSAFSSCSKLTSFSVDPGNPSYSSRNGLLCSKDGSKLVMGVNGDVTIPPGVKDIGDHAFQGCIGLTSVAIPSSVTNIGREAFDQCEGLTSVAIPSSVKSIGSRAFTMCFQIKSVAIPEGVTSIGEYAFAWCHAIETVAIPQSVTDIKGNTFAGCGGLKSVTIPNSVTSIGDYSFVGCKGLTSVTIPASVTYVGVGAFYRCDGLKTVALPSSVASIGKGAFAETPFYDGMPDGLVVLGGGVLCKYKGECPSSVTIPSNVTSIGEHAFRACSRLESLTIPSTVTNIDGRAFVECPNLRTVHVVREGKVETMSFDDFFKRWKNVVAQRLQRCDFLLNKDFKRDAKVYLCLFSASWCGPCRAEMPRIAKTYAKSLKDDPNIELILFSRDQNDEEALAWAKEHDVKFPVVKYSGGNPLNLQTSGIPHLFIVKADGTLVEQGRPMKLFTDEKLRSLTTAN